MAVSGFLSWRTGGILSLQEGWLSALIHNYGDVCAGMFFHHKPLVVDWNRVHSSGVFDFIAKSTIEDLATRTSKPVTRNQIPEVRRQNTEIPASPRSAL